MNIFRLMTRLILVAILGATVFVFVWMAVIPSGKVSYLWNFRGYNDFIGELTPPDRIIKAKGLRLLIGDPAYFFLRTSRAFNEAKVTIKFKASPNLPIVELGVSTDGRTWQYNLQPLYNKKIEDLIASWSSVQDGDVRLLQRQKNYDTVSDFLQNPPATDKIASYNYNLNIDYKLADYQATFQDTNFCRPLVGAYQYYTYIKNETLAHEFTFQDLNKTEGLDPIDVYVYFHGALIDSVHLEDDGIISNTGAQKSWRTLRLELANLPEGAYKIEVRANGDIVTRFITTAQSKMAFINKVTMANAPEVSCGRNLFTNGSTVTVQTSHPDKLQKIQIIKYGLTGTSTSELNLSNTYQQFSATELSPIGNDLILQNDGLVVSGDGMFSPSREQMIDPTLKTVGAVFSAESDGVDYVITRYIPPVDEGDWMKATATFNLRNAFRMWNKYYFLISAPGLRNDDAINDDLKIEEIKIDLFGTSLWKKLHQ